MTTRLPLLLSGCLLAASTVFAAAPATSGSTYALLVGGLAGEKPYSQWYPDWLARLQTHLTQTAGMPAAHVVTLVDKAATMAAITNALANLAQRVEPQDQFILLIVGHGENTGSAPTLTLPGPDLTAPQLATALERITAKNQVILNFSASSGDFLKYLVAPGRVNLTATSPLEVQEPILAEFFLRGLESKRAAGTNGTATVRDAFNWAAQQTVSWICRWEASGAEAWKANGQETVAVFDKLYSGLPNRQLDSASDRNVADPSVVIQPPNGEVPGSWSKRRVIDQHPLLEDSGQPVGVPVLGDQGLQPILGAQPQDPGYLAGHTILGQPALIHP